MKTFFSSKFEGVLNAIQEIKNDISEFGGRISEAENRISETEDNVEKLQKTVNVMERQIATLNSDLDDLENSYHRCFSQLAWKSGRKRRGKLFVKVVVWCVWSIYLSESSSHWKSTQNRQATDKAATLPVNPDHEIPQFPRLTESDSSRQGDGNSEVWGTQSDVFPRLLSSGEETMKGIRWCEEASPDIEHLIQICLSSQTELAV